MNIQVFNLLLFPYQYLKVSSPANFSWHRYLASLETFQSEVTQLFSTVALPTPPAFLGYRGDWEKWVAALEDAFQRPLLYDNDTLKW